MTLLVAIVVGFPTVSLENYLFVLDLDYYPTRNLNNFSTRDCICWIRDYSVAFENSTHN